MQISRAPTSICPKDWLVAAAGVLSYFTPRRLQPKCILINTDEDRSVTRQFGVALWRDLLLYVLCPYLCSLNDHLARKSLDYLSRWGCECGDVRTGFLSFNCLPNGFFNSDSALQLKCPVIRPFILFLPNKILSLVSGKRRHVEAATATLNQTGISFSLFSRSSVRRRRAFKLQIRFYL